MWDQSVRAVGANFKVESRQCKVPRFTRTQLQHVRSKDHGGAIAIAVVRAIVIVGMRQT